MRSGKYPPVPGAYSGDLRALLDALLQRDPGARPCVADVLDLVFVRGHLRKYAARSRTGPPAAALGRNGRHAPAEAPSAVRCRDDISSCPASMSSEQLPRSRVGCMWPLVKQGRHPDWPRMWHLN